MGTYFKSHPPPPPPSTYIGRLYIRVQYIYIIHREKKDLETGRKVACVIRIECQQCANYKVHLQWDKPQKTPLCAMASPIEK
jgi:hypothetical protein